jgi:hypothetical protein
MSICRGKSLCQCNQAHKYASQGRERLAHRIRWRRWAATARRVRGCACECNRPRGSTVMERHGQDHVWSTWSVAQRTWNHDTTKPHTACCIVVRTILKMVYCSTVFEPRLPVQPVDNGPRPDNAVRNTAPCLTNAVSQSI